MANSKYYNPHTFDPQRLEYQNDVRLAVRDELPDHISNEDVYEVMYHTIFMTELTWPSLFFGAWSAMEPDVFHYWVEISCIACHPLPLGERTFKSYV